MKYKVVVLLLLMVGVQTITLDEFLSTGVYAVLVNGQSIKIIKK